MAADRAELEKLIRAADAAGDGAAVQVLFAEMDKLGQPARRLQMAPPPGTLPLGMTPQGAGAAMFMPQSMGNLMDTAGVTAEAKPSDVVAMGPEVALQGATGLLGTAVGGLAGIGQGIKNRFSPGMPADQRVQQVQQAMTYQPRTAGGQMLSSTVGLPGRAWQAGTNKAGEFVTDVTGLPSLGAAIKTVGDVAPAIIPGIAASRGPKGPRPNEKFVDTKNAVPTTEQLIAQSDAAYKAADASNVVIRPESTRRVVDLLQRIADEENLGKLPPKMKEASDILRDRADAGKPLSLRDADKVRQLINDAKKSTDAADQRLATVAQKEYDSYLDNLQPSDTLAGNSAQGVALLKEARDLFRKRRGSEMIDDLEHNAALSGDAKYSQAGLEHALRQEFLKLARNRRERKKLTHEQQAAIDKVAAPGKLANTLRNIGKFDPVKGGMPAFMTSVVGGGGGALFGGPLGAVVGPALLGTAANLANRKASSITRGNVAKAREAMVGRSTGGLLDAGEATQPLVAPRGLLGGSAPRSAAQLRSEIASLDAEVQRLQAAGPAASTVRAAVESEVARLRRELEAAVAQGARP
jgi:hypothetical protein